MAKTSWTTPALFTGPALLIFTVVLAAPLLYSIGLSFFEATVITLTSGEIGFVGWGNYTSLAADQDFRRSLWRLGVFAVTTTLLEVALALAVAVYLEQVLRVPKVIELTLVLPMFVIPVVSGLVFRYIFDPGEGVFASVWGWFGLEAPGMLADPDLAMVAIVVQDVWRMWPFLFLIIYAGLKSLPQEPIEAARLDGAGTWATFRYVLLPMLRETLVVALLLKLIESLKAFTEIQVMTGGGPGEATELLSHFIVQEVFVFFQLGYGAAASTAVFVLGLAGATLLLVLQNRRKEVVS